MRAQEYCHTPMRGFVTRLSNKERMNRFQRPKYGRFDATTYCDTAIEVGVLDVEYDAIAVNVPLAGSRLND